MEDTLFEAVTISDLELIDRELVDRSFYECTFVDCDFSNTVFSGCIFSDCRFEGCNLTMIKLNHSRLNNIVFQKCKMVGVNFTAAAWIDAPPKKRRDFSIFFEDCALNYSIFIAMNLLGAKFTRCMLNEVGFESADLRGAIFDRCDLVGALFAQTNLSKADFGTSKNYTIDVRANNVSGAVFALPEAMSLIYALDITLS